MSKAYHCDGEDCDSWTYHKKNHDFLTVKGQGGGALHFCSWDCILKFSAKFEPINILDVDVDDVDFPNN